MEGELRLKVLAYVAKMYNSGTSRVVVVPQRIQKILELKDGDLVQISITPLGINDGNNKIVPPSNLKGKGFGE